MRHIVLICQIKKSNIIIIHIGQKIKIKMKKQGTCRTNIEI